MSQDALKVRMFGGFTLEYKGRELVLDRNIASKTMQLLQIMLMHAKDDGISKAALIEALYGRKDVENKNGSLNNTLFRLRKQLKSAGLPDSNYIIINAGICRWDPLIEVSVDVLEFKQLIHQGKNEKRKEERAAIWAKARKLYTGEFLPDMIGEDWVAVENVHCRELYFMCVEELCHYLQTQERYEDLHQVAHGAADIYPFDDWQIWEIDSLIGMSRYKEGMEVYKKTAKLMFDEMGISPSPKLMERFRLMGERTSQAAGAIEDIKYRLKEKETEPGAYYCAFPSFVDVYHVFSRMMERTGISVFLMLCTLDFVDREASEEEEKEMSELLRQSIQSSTRKGDFYTRYNRHQYLAMLIGINQENCPIVSKRIDKAFRSRTGNRKNIQIDYYVASVGEVCDEEEGKEERRFSENRTNWKENDKK